MKIVGIGASAGGLEAFQALFGNLPPNSGMAFVVILHLPSGRKSILAEIIGRWTEMPVVEAAHGARIEPNHIYVPPPHAVISIEDGALRILRPPADAPRDYRPIDRFFDALAKAARDEAIGIVLSGTGSDGALGLKAIKECGGFTIAQGRNNGSFPQYEDMPAGAIATGAVDLIAAAEAIPLHLMRLAEATAPIEATALTAQALDTMRLELCAILRSEVGHDFSHYRDKTFMRRVQRRMQVCGLVQVGEYIERLRIDHEEVMLLFRDLLIRVTSFFRDTEAFTTLSRLVLPLLFANKHAADAVRIWVPGCATGEEAYSLAILLCEQMDGMRAPPKVQVFGTDIDEPAIAAARSGRYPATLLEGLSDDRRRRFFQSCANGYVVSKQIRELCTFSSHSIIRDPPFSRMDLISCRNLLIYMDAPLQGLVIPAFHYSLVPGGILLLGSSESTARHEDLFEPLDKATRIFRKRDMLTPQFNLKASRADNAQTQQISLQGGRPVPPGASAPEQRPAPDGVAADRAANTQRPTSGSFAMTGRLNAGLGPIGTGLRSAWRRLTLRGETVARLSRELLATREQLQSLSEEHQTAVEEIRSANEELHSVNEELQSTNEELETSKEELQSVNEELNTVNARLTEKVDELDRANSDLRNLFASTQIATIFLDRHLIIRGFTPAVGSIYNLIPSDQGRPLTDIVSSLDYTGLREDVLHVLDTLQPLERRVTHSNREIHYIMRILPYRAPDSSVSGTLITFVDVTTIVKAETHQRLLVDELNHRVKNMLTVVVSIAAQTLRQSEDLEGFSEPFMGRLRALTSSYTLLSRQNWQSVDLQHLLTEATRPVTEAGRHNIVMQGPDVSLAVAGALALGMAIHELATNAVKYGALSTPQGMVTIRWRIEDQAGERQFVLEWLESHGPPVPPPQRRGFGTTLIERGFVHELAGAADIRFDVTGVNATLRAPAGHGLTFDPDRSDGREH